MPIALLKNFQINYRGIHNIDLAFLGKSGNRRFKIAAKLFIASCEIFFSMAQFFNFLTESNIFHEFATKSELDFALA
jgi:hypothetical protein